MKKIECIVRTHRLEALKDALVAAGHHGMTVTEVRGYGRQKGHRELYRGAEYRIDFVPKIKVELIAEDADAAKIIELVVRTARSGEIGDGKIFVSEVGEVIRIRTGETGKEAL